MGHIVIGPPPAAPLLPAGMTKSGNYTMQTSYQLVTGWIVASGYTGTVITGNQIVVSGSGTCIVHASVQWNNNGNNDTEHWNIYVNGSSVATYSSTATTGTHAFSWSGSLNNGDTVAMYAMDPGGGANGTSVRTGTNTYLHVDP